MKNALLFLLTSLVLSGCTGDSDKINISDSKSSSEKIEKKIEKSIPKTQEGKLALCLKEKGVTVYGTSWCSHCKDQKKKFGSESKEFLNFVDCDKKAGECKKEGITAYPTWKFPDNSVLMGSRPLDELAKKSGCEYIK